jgi:hypothetical protein
MNVDEDEEAEETGTDGGAKTGGGRAVIVAGAEEPQEVALESGWSYSSLSSLIEICLGFR